MLSPTVIVSSFIIEDVNIDINLTVTFIESKLFVGCFNVKKTNECRVAKAQKHSSIFFPDTVYM